MPADEFLDPTACPQRGVADSVPSESPPAGYSQLPMTGKATRSKGAQNRNCEAAAAGPLEHWALVRLESACSHRTPSSGAVWLGHLWPRAKPARAGAGLDNHAPSPRAARSSPAAVWHADSVSSSMGCSLSGDGKVISSSWSAQRPLKASGNCAWHQNRIRRGKRCGRSHTGHGHLANRFG